MQVLAYDDDEGPFFDLDFSSASVRASSSSASASSDDAAALTDLDLAISLHRSRSASPSYDYDARRLSHLHFFPPSHAPPPPPLLLKPGSNVGLRAHSSAGAAAITTNAALYGGRRCSSAGSGARLSLRQFMECPTTPGDAEAEREPPGRQAPPPRAVVRRYLAEISVRLRWSVRPRRLRKSRSAAAAAAATATAAPARRDDSLAEKQDGIASAIAHCKESLHRGPAPSVSPPQSSDCKESRSFGFV